MRKVLLFGSTGKLGKEVAQELVNRGYELTVVVRNEEKAKTMTQITSHIVFADVCQEKTLQHVFDHQEIVISALGKSVSPFDTSKATFQEVDYTANKTILRLAQKAGIRKFIYVSAFHAERYPHLNYFKVHHDFSELLKKSGVDYAIIKPPAIFSAFLDMIDLAQKGLLVTIGKGDKKTNPIYEGDLARIIVQSIHQQNGTIEAGGRTIYTRKQLNEIIQNEVGNQKKIWAVPLGLLGFAVLPWKLIDKNTYDKLAFFIEVMKHDTIAPQVGSMTFEEYVKLKVAGR